CLEFVITNAEDPGECDSSGNGCSSSSCYCDAVGNCVPACTLNGQVCSLDGECCSGHCAADYDGSGKWCEPPASCAHDTDEYLNGAKAPDCYTDGCSEWYCNFGFWNTSNCGSYACSEGNCSGTCSQICGAFCDEGSDCAQPSACGDISGGSFCTSLQWENITNYTCNASCACNYTSTCYDADDLKEACEICTGNVWDPITSRCCGDDGVSDTWCNNRNGACVSGIWYPDHCSDGVQDCDELEIDCGDGDGDCCMCDGQSCLTGDECCSGSCVLGACMMLENIELHFVDNASGSVTLVLGSQSVLVLKVRNNLPVKETIRLQLIDFPDPRIVYWSKFSNNDKVIDVEVGPGEEVAVPVTVFGGQVGTYELRVFAESVSYSSLIAHESVIIYVTQKDEGLFSRSPGLSWLCLIIIALIGSLVLQKRMYL
ncbi:MAG: hypothetical protein U9Q92_06975, partial [archaeon]|nr:hypothetical protein [archaeon]